MPYEPLHGEDVMHEYMMLRRDALLSLLSIPTGLCGDLNYLLKYLEDFTKIL